MSYSICENDALAELYSRIPQVPCNGCYYCCIGIEPGTLKCPHLINGRCVVRDRRSIWCRIYGTIEGQPCLKGRHSIRSLTREQACDIINLHTALAGVGPYEVVPSNP